MKETLHTCPTCHTPNFTERGLKAHRCKGINRSLAAPGSATSEQPAQAKPSRALEVVAPGTLSSLPSLPSLPSDSDLGAQLTAQYKRAVSGMREVLIFGAMLMQLEESVSARGHANLGNEARRGTGLKGWLEAHAPEISRPTAYRFLGITKSIAEEYEAIVGSQIAGRYDLPALVCADPATLSEKARLKQGELFDYVSGTSQRSWLDQFKGDSREGNGGHRERPNGTKRRTRDMKEFDDKEHLCLNWYKSGFDLVRMLHLDAELTWMHLPDVELANIADLLKFASKKADEACRARRIVPSQIRDWDKNLPEAGL